MRQGDQRGLQRPGAAWASLTLPIVFYVALFSLEPWYTGPIRQWMAGRGIFDSHGIGVAAVSVALIAASLGAGNWLIDRAVIPPLSPRGTILATGVAALLWLALIAAPGFREIGHWLAAHRVLLPLYRALQGLALAAGAAGVGRLVALSVRDRNLVAAAVVVGGLVDYWGVNIGTTRLFIERHPLLHHQVSVAMPHVGLPSMLVLVGPGDYIFAGIMFALVHKFDLHPRAVWFLMWLLLTASMVGVLVFGWSVPAVAPMAAAVVLPNIREFHFSRSELFAMAYALGLLVLLAGTWWLVSHQRGASTQPASSLTSIPRTRSAPSSPQFSVGDRHERIYQRRYDLPKHLSTLQ